MNKKDEDARFYAERVERRAWDAYFKTHKACVPCKHDPRAYCAKCDDLYAAWLDAKRAFDRLAQICELAAARSAEDAAWRSHRDHARESYCADCGVGVSLSPCKEMVRLHKKWQDAKAEAERLAANETTSWRCSRRSRASRASGTLPA